MKKIALLIVAILFSLFALFLVIWWFDQFPYPPGSPEYECQFITQKTFKTKIQPTIFFYYENFRIWPDKYRIKRGHETHICVGIKNDADDNKSHQFVINVIPSTASNNVCPGGDLDVCKDIKSDMQSWASWNKQSFAIDLNKVEYRIVTINSSLSANLGTYIFNIIACTDVSSYSDCTPQNYNWGIQHLIITVIS